MKKYIYLGVGILGLGLAAFKPLEDVLEFKIKASEINFTMQTLEGTKQVLSNSDLPAKQYTAIVGSIDSVERIIRKSYVQPQVVKPVIVDTIKNKKKKVNGLQ